MLFRSLRESERQGHSNVELLELAGDFEKKARANGWWQRTLVLSEDERRVLFQIRWSTLTRLLQTFPFAPSLDDWRVYYGVLLEHPENSAGRGTAELAAQRLSYAHALAQRDASYPIQFAEGILHLQSGQPAEAAQAFEAYLADPTHRRWRLRARNHLLACAFSQETL